MFVDFNILNQLGSPAINSNTFANRPAAGQTGRLFVSTDTFEIYRDNGTTWDLIGGPGSSTITGTGTATQVAYFTSSQAIGSSANLYWDNTAGALGINTATPGAELDVHGTGTVAQFNTTAATGNVFLALQRSGTGLWRIGDTYNSGSNYFELHNTSLANNAIQIAAATNKSILTSIETYSTGVARGNLLDYTLSLANGTTFTSPNTVTALGATLNLNIAGSATIPATARSGADFFNGINFTSAGTFTVNQASTIRAFSNVTAGWAFNGSAVGTVTHLAGLRVLFPTNSGSAINVTDNYALLINNQNANTGTITYTNRWGIYQEGSSDLNYMAANLLLGSTTNTGEKLQVTGTAKVTSTFTANGISSIGQEQAFTWQRTTGTASDVYSLNADSASAYLYNNTTANALMTWLEGGNVGIGISPNTTFTGYRSLQVGSSTTLTSNATGIGSFYLGNNAFLNSTPAWERINTGFASDYYQENGRHAWRTAASGNAGTTFTYSQVMTLDASGNLGLGVSPAAWENSTAFQVDNQYAFTKYGITRNAVYNAGYKYITNGFANSYEMNGGAYQWFTAVSGTAGNAITFTQPMTLTASGNLLIGTTTDAGQKLQVNGTSYLNGNTSVNTSAAKGALNVNGTIGLRFGATRTYSQQGDVVISVSDLEPLNGNNWKNALLLIAYTGIEGNQSNDTTIYCMVKLQGLTTWNSATVSNIVGTATVTLTNAASTSCTITLDVNNSIVGSAYVVLADVNSGNLS